MGVRNWADRRASPGGQKHLNKPTEKTGSPVSFPFFFKPKSKEQ